MDSIRIFVSFDHVHDRAHRQRLSVLSECGDSTLTFDCLTDEEAGLNDVAAAKSLRARKIREAAYTLVVVGCKANQFHADKEAIGTRNWQWWDIEESDRQGKTIIAVRLEPEAALPNTLFGKKPAWAKALTADAILHAIRGALIKAVP